MRNESLYNSFTYYSRLVAFISFECCFNLNLFVEGNPIGPLIELSKVVLGTSEPLHWYCREASDTEELHLAKFVDGKWKEIGR